MSNKTPAKGVKGSGNFYGSGVKNPVGKVREGTVGINPVPKASLKKPPRSLA